jgi:deoxyribodipyrimidine photo-lyase
VKDLHIEWQRGARHFMAWLVDGDVAQNQLNWQWVAGTGRDAAPYFRVFNPVLQGEKFDPDGTYVRRWVPELRGVAGRAVHQPWRLGHAAPSGYPERVVDHATERKVALDALSRDR